MTSLTRTPSGKLRARGIGLTFAGTPGPNNAITDVPGVTVGYETLIEGDSVRTGCHGDLTQTQAGPRDLCVRGLS